MKRLVILTIILSAFMSIYVMADIDYKCVESTVTLNYMNKSIKNYDILYCNGRLFVPFEEACKDFEIEVMASGKDYVLSKGDKWEVISSSTGKSNKTDMYFYNNRAYVYIYKLIEPFGYIPIVDTDNNRINIFKSVEAGITKYKSGINLKKSAYIRLEDIMADGNDTTLEANYNTDMLEKLRYTAQYLYECGQSYYIAWIPVYAHPKINYWNDVSQTYNLYNSYFVYTLDYMIEHNGHLGLHGYTHQYGSEISAVGFEWGENTPYSSSEQENRIKKAIKCADRLGYVPEFFEFPHYGATSEQLKMAGKYFDLIYQSYPKKELSNSFLYTSVTGKKVYYMPTPADYLHTKYDVKDMISRLSDCINKNYAVSLFYHPVIDKNVIRESTVNNKRVWGYKEGALPDILKYVSDRGYIFSPIVKS